MSRFMLVIGLAVVLVACGEGVDVNQPTMTAADTRADLPTATTEPAAGGAPALGKIGERVEAGGIAVTVLSVVPAPAELSSKNAAPGNILLQAEVMIENASRQGPTSYNAGYFKIADSTGVETKGKQIAGVGHTLVGGPQAPGEKAQGTVLFEVPEGASGFVITYQPQVISHAPYEPIRIETGL